MVKLLMEVVIGALLKSYFVLSILEGQNMKSKFYDLFMRVQ